MNRRSPLAKFVREKRRRLNLTQIEFAEKTGVGLRFLRKLEQGDNKLRLDKVEQFLALFGHVFKIEKENEE